MASGYRASMKLQQIRDTAGSSLVEVYLNQICLGFFLSGF
jgi:hypothetical protein